MSEHEIQLAICSYLRLQYPSIIFASDYAAGLKLSKFQAAMQKMFKSNRGYPDLFIAEPRKITIGGQEKWVHGCYIELKKDGVKLMRDKDARKILKGDYKLRKIGDWWDLHTEEQANTLNDLTDKGYFCMFAVGLKEAKQVIDDYLAGTPHKKHATMAKELAKTNSSGEGLPF